MKKKIFFEKKRNAEYSKLRTKMSKKVERKNG